MKFRAHMDPFHNRAFAGDFSTFDEAARAGACSPSPGGGLDGCRCGGGSVVAVLETAADRALVAETVDGMRYAFVPGDFGVTLPLPFVGEEPEK